MKEKYEEIKNKDLDNDNDNEQVAKFESLNISSEDEKKILPEKNKKYFNYILLLIAIIISLTEIISLL